MNDLRKFMNILNESLNGHLFENPQKPFNVKFEDPNDGYDVLYSFASKEDADIYITAEQEMSRDSIYDSIDSAYYVDDVASQIIPAGTLSKFSDIVYGSEDEEDYEFNEEYYHEIIALIEPYGDDISGYENASVEDEPEPEVEIKTENSGPQPGTPLFDKSVSNALMSTVVNFTEFLNGSKITDPVKDFQKLITGFKTAMHQGIKNVVGAYNPDKLQNPRKYYTNIEQELLSNQYDRLTDIILFTMKKRFNISPEFAKKFKQR